MAEIQENEKEKLERATEREDGQHEEVKDWGREHRNEARLGSAERKFPNVREDNTPTPLENSVESREKGHFGYNHLDYDGKDDVNDMLFNNNRERAIGNYSSKLGEEFLSGDPAMNAFTS